jgi:hypothetical protein
LEVHAGDDVIEHQNKHEEKEGLFSPVVDKLETPNHYPFGGGFLVFCNNCHKKFEEGKDIYIYR